MRKRTFLLVGLTAVLLAITVGALCACQSTTTDPWTGQEVTREQLAANKDVREAQARASALEAAATEQAKKDAATRAARTALGSIERTTTAKVERLDAEHASQVRDIRTTAEDAVAKIAASVEDVAQSADFNIAKANRALEAETSKITGLFAGATAELNRKDAVKAQWTGGIGQVLEIATPAVKTAVAGTPYGTLALGALGLLGTWFGTKKITEKKAEEKVAAVETKAADAFIAIDVAKEDPEFRAAWDKKKDLIKTWAGDDATKFVHTLKESGKAA